MLRLSEGDRAEENGEEEGIGRGASTSIFSGSKVRLDEELGPVRLGGLLSQSGNANKQRLRDLLWNETTGVLSSQAVQLKALAQKRASGERTSSSSSTLLAASASSSSSALGADTSGEVGSSTPYLPQPRLEVKGKNIVVVKESMQHNIKVVRGGGGGSGTQNGEKGEDGGGGDDDDEEEEEGAYIGSAGPMGGPSLSALPRPQQSGGFGGGVRGGYGQKLKRRRMVRWTPEETKRFFYALRLCGTDFSLMEPMFPNRDRKDLKLKYSREDKDVSGGLFVVCRFFLPPPPPWKKLLLLTAHLVQHARTHARTHTCTAKPHP